MGFFATWRQKLGFWLRYKFVQAVDIQPFIKRDKNAYCPCCGHRQGRIVSVTDMQRVNLRHVCDVCTYIWDEESVTEILPQQIVRLQDEPEEDGKETKAEMRYKPRFVTIPPRGAEGVKVNGQTLPAGPGEEPKKPKPVVGTI